MKVTADEVQLLRRINEDFADCGETEVPYTVLLDFAQRGLLEAELFRFTPAGAAAILDGVGGTDHQGVCHQSPMHGKEEQKP